MFFLIYLFFLHWIGDFVCQNRYMAENKSSCLKALSSHVLAYTAVLTTGVFLTWQFDFFLLPLFFLMNFVGHFCIDKVSSQYTNKFKENDNTKAFFVTIGFDQFLHTATLILISRFVLGI